MNIISNFPMTRFINMSHSPSEKQVKNLPSTKKQQQHDLSCFLFDEVNLVKFMVPSYKSRPSHEKGEIKKICNLEISR